MTARIVVVGGGVIGLTCAWQLAQAGAAVVLLEQAHIGSGSTGSALGILAYPSPLKRSPFHTLQRESLRSFPAFSEQLEATSGVSVDYKVCGLIEKISSKPQLDSATREVQSERDLSSTKAPALKLLSSSEATSLEPSLAPCQYGFLFSPNAATVNVDSLLMALTVACKRAGVLIRDNCHLSSIEFKADRVVGVNLNEGLLGCDSLLVCAGTNSSALLGQFAKYALLIPVKGEAIMLESEAASLHRAIRNQRVYIVPITDNRFVVGSTTDLTSGFDLSVTDIGRQKLFSTAVDALPKLVSAKLIKSWAGLRPASLDRKPIVGAIPGVEGLFVATGHYKIGIGFAPITAKLVTQYIFEGTCKYDATILLPRLGQTPLTDANKVLEVSNG